MRPRKVLHAVLMSCLLFLMATVSSSWAKPDASVKFSLIREENPRQQKNQLVLPYAFSTDSLGLTLGVGGMIKGYGQDQLMVAGTAMASFDNAAIGALGLWNYQLPVVKRLFFSAVGTIGHYPNQRAYVNAPRQGDVPSAGSNDSHKNDYLVDIGSDNWVDFKLEYVLPLGNGKTDAVGSYKLKGGILQDSTPIGSWNPLQTGTTVMLLKQYNRYQSLELPFSEQDYTIHPLKAGLYYNHTDYPTNPSMGSSQFFAYTKDFGWGDSEKEWDFIEFEASKYFNIGRNSFTKQQVLALNFWTGYSPGYNATINAEGNHQVTDNPPYNEGAKLGGLFRMRAYPSNRFNDKAVIYATAEYRWTPEWNPIGEASWLKFLHMDWMQFVPFIEIGRVADEYDLGELLSDMKVDGGIGFRAKMSGVVIRLDVAVSEEGFSSCVMAGHPF